VPHKFFHPTLSIDEAAFFALVPVHGVRFHQQDDHGDVYYCGAASAQMVLESIGAGLIDQDPLFSEIQAHSAADPGMIWFSAPDGLTCTLNNRKPASFLDTFKLWVLDSEEAISRKICWAIQRGVAPIALIEGGAHWLVVVGFTASGVPTSSTDTGYDIESFDVFNPIPVTSGGPPPHLPNGLDHCGTGYDFGALYRGDEYETSSYAPQGGATGGDGWRTDYMTPVRSGRLAGKFVAICDEDPPPDVDVTPIVLSDSLITDLEEIKARATTGLNASGQAQRPAWNSALNGAQVGEPLLVEREYLDPPRFYYIVPFLRGDSDVPVLALVDAYESGGLAGSIAAPGPNGSTHFNRALSRDAVIQTFAGQQVEVDGAMVTLEAADLHKNLVWRPCGESLSPYWPIYRFDVGGPGGPKVYIRIDGELFTELHEGFGM
jgi:hypothetical protein